VSAMAALATAPAAAGLRLGLAGETVLCRPSGALWLKAHATLIAADLHLEKGSFFAARGQMLPPYDTADTLRRLAAEVAALDPARIVLLGDSFHDRQGEARLSEGDIAAFHVLAAGRRVIWITGNHDPLGPALLPGEAAAELALGPLVLVHEPHPAPRTGEIAGHLHPCARVRARGASVRRRCFATDGARMVLPAFGALAGGLNLRDVAFRALFPRRPLAAVLGRETVHAVGWSSLRGD
jgi:uncharacterized protein